MEDSGIDSDQKGILSPATDDVLNLREVDLDSSDNSGVEDNVRKSASRQLQRKLEQKLATHQQSLQTHKKCNTPQNSLLPIQRLSIPTKFNGTSEQLPLVDWDTDSSSDVGVDFFPTSKPPGKTSKLVADTFSIEEFPLSDEDEDLNLMPPHPVHERYTCCYYPLHVRCAIM